MHDGRVDRQRVDSDEDPFARTTIDVARALIGALLVHETDEGIVSGRIVETEAYLAADDPASHSHRGETPRTASMFGEPGCAYVYTSYGVHRCFNVATSPAGIGEAVLVRALEPLDGLTLMRARRGGAPDRELCRGPGNVCAALAITLAHDSCDLRRGALRIVWPDHSEPVPEIDVGPRVGISRATALALRFAARASPWVSRPRIRT